MAKKKAKDTPVDDVMEQALGVMEEEPKSKEEPEAAEPKEPIAEEPAEEVDDTGTLQDKSEEAEAARAAAEAPEEEPEEPEQPAAEEEPAADAAADALEAQQVQNKALRDELTSLRAKNRELVGKQAAIQAPPPQGPPVPQPGTAAAEELAQAGTEQNIAVEFDADGKAFIPASAIQPLVQTGVAQATAKDPQREFDQLLATERTQWIGTGEDAPQRTVAATRMQEAAEFLAELTTNYSLRTGAQPQGLVDMVNTIEQSGLGDTFRGYFPEMTDTYGLVDAFFTPALPKDRVAKIKRFMDSRSGSPAAATVPAETDTPQPAAQPSNVVPLVAKPRSMAKKGAAAVSDTGARSRYDALNEKQALSPFTVTDEENAEWEALNEKYGEA